MNTLSTETVQNINSKLVAYVLVYFNFNWLVYIEDINRTLFVTEIITDVS